MKVCLVIIAKNESHVIGRAIESAINFVDFVYVCDTGSTRQEQMDMENAIQMAWPHPYMFDVVEWINFAWNRTYALRQAELAYPDADYLFMIDADDYVEQMTVMNAGLAVPGVTGFNVMVRSDGIEYPRTQIFKADIGWHYRGVVHEFPECPVKGQVPMYPIAVRSTREGDRNRDGRKYAKDAELLETALALDEDTDLVPRYCFYLAQSYDAAGEPAKASEWYMHRAANEGGYQEERYVALLRNARLMLTYDADLEQLVSMCHRAQEICSHRREMVCLTMKELNENSKYDEAYALWTRYPLAPKDTPIGLFIEAEVYQWRYFDEAAICAHYVGNNKLSLSLGILAAERHPMTPLDVKRLVRNMKFSISKL